MKHIKLFEENSNLIEITGSDEFKVSQTFIVLFKGQELVIKAEYYESDEPNSGDFSMTVEEPGTYDVDSPDKNWTPEERQKVDEVIWKELTKTFSILK